MLKFKSINYSTIDLIELIKNNTAAMLDISPGELFVNLKVDKNRKVYSEVIRKDGKELELLNE